MKDHRRCARCDRGSQLVRWHRRDRSSELRRDDVVGRLSAVHRLEPIFDRAGEQELHKPLIAPARLALERVVAAINPLNLELLTCLYAVLLPDFRWQNNLALAGNLW